MVLCLVNDQNKNIDHVLIIKTSDVLIWVMVAEQVKQYFLMKLYFFLMEQ